jgi:carboxyl-terminal processing protease
MRDNSRAVLIGTKTYGKGVMQLVSAFGDGYISLTTASFSGPTGEAINKEGVQPDIEVKEVYVEEDEIDAYNALVDRRAPLDFIEKNPEYTDANLKKFAAENAGCGLREELLIIIVRNEYIYKMKYEDRPIADIKYDVACKTAYEYLHSKDKSVVNF